MGKNNTATDFFNFDASVMFFGKSSKPKEEINSQERDSVSFRATYKFAYLFPPGYRLL